MTYIPDGRTDEYYNERYLIGKDEQFIAGYDWAVNYGINVFFSSLEDDYYNERSTIISSFIDSLAFEDMMMILAHRKDLADALKEEIENQLEMERDSMITAMFDSFEKNNKDELIKLGLEPDDENIFEKYKLKVDSDFDNGIENSVIKMQKSFNPKYQNKISNENRPQPGR